MKKIYILVKSKKSMHKICTHDLCKMYYFQKTKLPRLPSFYCNTNSDEDEISVDSSINKNEITEKA